MGFWFELHGCCYDRKYKERNRFWIFNVTFEIHKITLKNEIRDAYTGLEFRRIVWTRDRNQIVFIMWLPFKP